MTNLLAGLEGAQMQFTIDVELELGLAGCKRLIMQDQWRDLHVKDLAIVAGDRVLDDLADARKYTQRDYALEFGGVTFKVNPTSFSFGTDRTAHVFARVHRTLRPHRFSIEELRAVIRNGRDNQHNALVVHLSGHLSLEDFATLGAGAPHIAVRHETFSRGTGNVGNQAASDDGFIGDVYKSMLSGWISHLATGKPHVYRDFAPAQSIEALEGELDELYAKFGSS